MKVKNLIIASTFAIALGTIFTSCSDNKTGGNTTTNGGANTEEVAPNAGYNGKIAYIRMDSLMTGYGMYIDMSDEFSAKGKKVEAELTSRGRSLEREVMAYQEKAQKGLITRFEAQKIEEGLQQKNQSAVRYRDEKMAELQQNEIEMSAKISEAIMTFLKKYNTEKGYSMIIQSTAGTPVLLADPALDITTEVLDGLNEEYLASKGTAKKVEEVAKEAETAAAAETK